MGAEAVWLPETELVAEPELAPELELELEPELGLEVMEPEAKFEETNEAVTEPETDAEIAPTTVSERRIEDEDEEEEEEEDTTVEVAEDEEETDESEAEVVAVELKLVDDTTSVLVEVGVVVEEKRLMEGVARAVTEVEVGVCMKVEVITELVG